MRRFRIALPIAALLGAVALVGCGSDKGVGPMEDGMNTQAAAKLASAPTATVTAVVTENGSPVTGATVAFSRSVAGRSVDYRWTGTTDANGRAEVDITADRGGASGYYLARAIGSGGDVIGEWGSIPINGGRVTEMLLPVGERVEITAKGAASGKTVFRVRIENISTAYPYIASGVFNTPEGATEPGPIGSGDAYQFSFDAGPGSRLSFAAMFGQSNDFFYGPDDDGIALWDANGDQVSGDVTSQVMLWDAGTEVNQEPGVGADQAPRQSGPNTGAADPNGTVRLAPDTFSNLPDVADVLQVTVTPTSATGFTVRIENVSGSNTLTTSNGPAPVLVSPGVYVLHTTSGPIFTTGSPDLGDGLERIAEDGDPTALAAVLAGRTGVTTVISPGAWAVHTGSGVIFTEGIADYGEGLEAQAEDGSPAILAASLAGRTDVMSSGAYTIPDGAATAGPVTPGGSFSFVISAAPGSRLSFASMYGQSNDYFYGPGEDGIALWDTGGDPVSGDVTSMVSLWDAGTEVNQIPGVGVDQAPRQAAPNTGAADPNATVRSAEGEYDVLPATSDAIRVTVTPLN